MNKFEFLEEQAAICLNEYLATRVVCLADICATQYAEPADLEAATIAVLLRALEIAGGSKFIKPQEEL